MLVTTNNWSSSTITSYHDKTITASVRNMVTGENHWLNGKVWKYRSWEELDKIQKFIDQLKVKLGILREYN